MNFDPNINKDDKFSFPESIPFKLDNASLLKPSIFEVVIAEEENGKDITYQYGFSVLNRKIESQSFSLDELKQINTENQETENKPEDSESNDEWDF